MTAPSAHTTIGSEPVAGVIERMHTDAEATKERFRRRVSAWSPRAMADWRGNTADYRALYMQAKDIHLAVSRRTARLLYVLARTRSARTVVEFGTSFGFSTLHLAAALRDNGGGRLITTEFEPAKVSAARASLTEAGLADLVEVREGDALQTLTHDVPDGVDLVFLDGAGTLYRAVTDLVEPHLSPAAVVVADNATGSPDHLEHVRNPGRYVSLDLGHDIESSFAP